MSNHFCFIKKLEELIINEDKGALAELRKISSKNNFATFRLLPHNVIKNSNQEKAALIIAPLFALWHQGKDAPEQLNEKNDYQDRKNMGFSFSLLAWKQADNKISEWKKAKERLEKRFNAILNCHIDDLENHLRYAVSLLKSADIKINWNQMYKDIQYWDHDDQYVQKNWARSFWTVSLENEDN